MTDLSRRDALRRGGAVALFGALASVLTQSSVVAQAQDELEAAPEAKKPGLTLRLLKEQRALQAQHDNLRREYDELKRGFGDLSILWETGGAGWAQVDPYNIEGMDELLEPWRRATGRRDVGPMTEDVVRHVRSAALESAERERRRLSALVVPVQQENSELRESLRVERERSKRMKKQLEGQGLAIRALRKERPA